MIKLLMIFTVLSPQGDLIASTERDVSLTMSYEQCVESAPSVGDILKEHYRNIKYVKVNVIVGCT